MTTRGYTYLIVSDQETNLHSLFVCIVSGREVETEWFLETRTIEGPSSIVTRVERILLEYSAKPTTSKVYNPFETVVLIIL